MVAENRVFGHKIIYDTKLEEWVYADTREIVDNNRRCPQCNRYPSVKGYDPCIGKLEGAESVCCGHGIEQGYIVWGNGNWYDDKRSLFRKHTDKLWHFLMSLVRKTKEIETKKLKF